MHRFLVVFLAVVALAIAGSASPIITSVTPSPLLAPNVPGGLFSGTVTITGSNFQGGDIYTDGPLALLGSSTVNGSGTVITRAYQIGCCGPYDGEMFNFYVATSNGSASISDSIYIVPEPNTLMLFGPAALGLGSLVTSARRKLLDPRI